MTRIVSYNILAGGYDVRANGAKRSSQLINIIRSAQPDIVGLVEAIHPDMQESPTVVEDIAQELDMQLIKGGLPDRPQDYQLGLLTRLPIIYTKIHERPGIILRPVVEVCVEEEDGRHLIIFLAHLSAAFNQGRGGGHIRVQEVREILRIMAPVREEGKAHVVMGDFNSLAPGEAIRASALLRYVMQMDLKNPNEELNDGVPRLSSVVPPALRFLYPVLRLIAKSDILCRIFDGAAYYYAPRGCIRLFQNAGYADSYRRMHPHEEGFTCPAAAPAGRIDYMFSSPTLVERLAACDVVVCGLNGVTGEQASDHLALAAEFGLKVQPDVQVAAQENVGSR